jgi:hypothetical protein
MPILFSYQYSINDIVLCKNMEEENLAWNQRWVCIYYIHVTV